MAANPEHPTATPEAPPPAHVEDERREHPEQHDRELFPEEAGDAAAHKRRARGYFKQHPRAKWVLLALFIVFGIAAWFVWHYYAGRESTDDAEIDGHIAPVSARITGTVQAVNVEDNAAVNTGDVLVQLDPTDYQVALARAQAQLADAQSSAQAAQRGISITAANTSSQLTTAEAGVAAAQKQTDAARAQMAQMQANYNKAANDLNRFKQLVAKDEISQQQYDAAVAAEQAAQAGVQASAAQVAAAQSHEAEARASVSAARTGPQQVGVTQARAGAAEASAAQAEAQVKAAQLNLQYTTIRAPEPGIVDKRSVEPGQVVQPGQPLISVVYVANLWVTADFKETQLAKMKIGDPAEIKVDAFGGRAYRGHVDSLGGATGARFSLLPPENASGNYVKVVQRVPIKIVFEPNQETTILRPGMSVLVTVKVSR